jgi:hypothetical protein
MKKIFFAVGLLVPKLYNAQISVLALNGQTINPITTAVPFLMISPDSKQGGMGDVGAATDPDVNSIHWNGSKLAMAEKKFGFGFTVTPWLRQLVPDINLYYLAGYCKISDRQAVGASLRYFSLGNIELTNSQGVKTSDYRPNEFAIDLAFSQQLSKNFSLGIATRYINSGISKVYLNQSSGNAASTAAADISMYFKSNKFKITKDNLATATAGLAFTNIGAKIKYSNDQNFIPMNMRLGGGLKTEIDKYNTIGVYLDFNKLLVPTPPIYQRVLDSAGNETSAIEIDPATGNEKIKAGKNPKVPVPTAILQSFGDAPGGIKEELKEINTCVGLEYWYNNIFAVRTGYFYESKTKGGRQYFTVGIGVKYSIINIDGSYLIPTKLNNPLQKTWRISISFDFEGVKKVKEPVQP